MRLHLIKLKNKCCCISIGRELSFSFRELKKQVEAARETLCRRGPFLCASVDEPVEEVQPVDADRSEDDTNYDRSNLCYNIEPVSRIDFPYVDLAKPLHRAEKHLFRYFLDGSIRTYYWGEKIEGNKGFPVMVAEVASAVIHREDDGKVRVAGFKRKLGLLTPPSPPLSDDTWQDVLHLKESFEHLELSPKLEVVPLAKAEEKADLRTSLAGKARSVMHDLEHELAVGLPRDAEKWLVIDGSIRKELFLHIDNTIGLAKSFSRKPVFSINNSRGVKDVVSMLSRLPDGHRTAVFKQTVTPELAGDSVKKSIAFWYLRLRSGRGLQSPLQGIVKVELCHKSEELAKEQLEEVDMISRALLAEKYVSPYPTPRWHAHIYPIFVAENYIKSSLYSTVYIRGLLIG